MMQLRPFLLRSIRARTAQLINGYIADLDEAMLETIIVPPVGEPMPGRWARSSLQARRRPLTISSICRRSFRHIMPPADRGKRRCGPSPPAWMMIGHMPQIGVIVRQADHQSRGTAKRVEHAAHSVGTMFPAITSGISWAVGPTLRRAITTVRIGDEEQDGQHDDQEYAHQHRVDRVVEDDLAHFLHRLGRASTSPLSSASRNLAAWARKPTFTSAENSFSQPAEIVQISSQPSE